MIFSSVIFLFVFFPIAILLYYLVPWRVKNFILLLTSLVFYAWGEPVYVFLMMFSILFNYLSALEMDIYQKESDPRWRRICFIGTIIVNLAILGFFKYYGFLLDNLNAILPFDIPYRELSLPVGISFYTFQILSYIIDVYRGAVPVQRNIISFGAYVTMFPQLIAGPIVRYSDIAAELQKRSLNWLKLGEGLTWFLRGLGKKVLLANNMGATFDAIAAIVPDERSALTAWIGALAYTMQIYFDFSGYSDMAIGLGKMLGFDFVQNFNYPYISGSVTDFWRRWHISLGTWFREYVYIPLGGNRVSVPKHIRNILVVWILTGFWHGAAWNFILWGLYYGLLLLLEKYVLGRVLEKIPHFFGTIYTMFFVILGWVLFSADSLPGAISYLGNMFGSAGFFDSTGVYYLTGNLIPLLLCFFCATPLVWRLFSNLCLRKGVASTVFATLSYAALFLFSLAYLIADTYNPFLYFRF